MAENVIGLSWADMKVIVAKKNLAWQYDEVSWGDSYHVFALDGGLKYESRVFKDNGTDCVDWETNYKADANWAIGARPYAFATGDFDFAPKTAIDTCTAGSTKSVLVAMCGTKYMNGGVLITNGNAAFGDWVEVQVVDHDNLLSYGVDFVLKSWVDKWYVNWKSCWDSIITPYAGLPPAGMYIKMTYHSVGQTDVGFALNLLMHKSI